MLHALLQEYFARSLPDNYVPVLHLEVGTHDPTRDTTRFRMSDAGKCRLMRYWKRQGKVGQPYQGNPFLLEAGNLFHAYIQHALIDQGRMIACEERLEDDHRIGHFDMLVNAGQPMQPTLYELKTVSEKQFYYKKKNAAPDKPHIAQIVTYADSYIRKVDKFPDLRIVYLNRDSLEFLEFTVEYYKQITAVTNDWETLIDAWNAQQEPTPNAENWECKYCQYATVCQHARN